MAEDSSIYSERYVAFIDILGFSNFVNRSTESPEQAKALVNALQRISGTLPIGFTDNLDYDLRHQTFSDCIVLSARATDLGLKCVLIAVGTLANNLLSQGLPTRGGISKGKLYHSDQVVIGPAMIAAYRLESTVADVPRIVLDRAVHEDVKRVGGWLGRAVKYDWDGPPFVDLFRHMRADISNEPVLLDRARIYRAVIQNLLNDAIYDPRIYKKIRWLAMEWDSVVEGEEPRDGLEPIEWPSGVALK